MIVGFDLDNTLVNYDDLIVEVASDLFPQFRSQLNDRNSTKSLLMEQPDGDTLWQQVQAQIYGLRMLEAKLYSPEIFPLLEQILSSGHDIRIISHKTETSPVDLQQISLRQKAMEWLVNQNFFKLSPRFGPQQVFFASTRAQKVQMIADNNCSVFVDDLVEVFEEPLFPKKITKILFSQNKTANPQWTNCSDWKGIADAVRSQL